MTPNKEKRVLVVEDEAHIAEGLKLNLELKGHAVRIAPDGVAALRDWKEWRPDLIVLDIMLPGIDGLSVLRSVRLEDRFLPILILSAKGDPEDKVKGFSHGVDDYLAKPFNLEEFLLRVERLLFRALRYDIAGAPSQNHLLPPDPIYEFGSNRVDFNTLTARGRAGQVQLTEKEAMLLKLFITNRGKPISRRKLLEIGWGYARGTNSRTVDNFIVRFRKYFEENPREPVYFKSLRSVGYIFDHEK
ncbi:MAG: response regulator transcription factor [Desulfobacterales bacterium]|nr:response regulator transcription factor [Desulfobacterales bacterium]